MANFRRPAVVAAMVLALGGFARAQGDPAQELLQQAQQNSAKGDLKAAAQQYQDFLQKFANHAQTSAARYQLGLVLLRTPGRDYSKIASHLDAAADDAKFAERSSALYWAGVAQREWARAVPAEAAAHLDQAARRFGEAAKTYGGQIGAWTDKGEKDLPAALEGVIRSNADQLEVLLASGKTKESVELAGSLSKQQWMARSRSRDTVAYLVGCAFFSADDLFGAARSLVKLAPFEQPGVGPHVRYLLGRIHHLSGDLTEAAEHYEAVPALFEKQVAAAREAIKAPMADQPMERARLEALAGQPAPDYVAEAIYHAGKLLYEQKKFADAQERFTRFLQKAPKSARADDARYLTGLSLALQQKYPEAVAALAPIVAHPKLGAMARGWTAKAMVRAADPGQAPAYKQALDQAVEHLKQATAQLEKRPEAASETTDLSFELGDTLRLAGRPGDAAPVYQKLVGGTRGEEAKARLVACLQLSGKFREAEDAARQFEKDFPRSPYLAEVLYYYAGCSYATAQAAAGDAGKPNYEEAVKRYGRIVKNFPDLAQIGLCRYRLAMSEHALGRYEEAAATLTSIPEQERGGASYVLADSLLRGGPPVEEARDAITAANRLAQLQSAAAAFQTFLTVQPQSADAPEAMIKLGYCLQQACALCADPAERVSTANAARGVYEQLRGQFPNHPLRAVAEYERANCYALAGDVATALSKLPRFHAEPLLKAPITPIAFLREAQLLRGLGRSPEAVVVLAECRAKFEEELKKDAVRASWVPLIRYHHGLALREAKQTAEAVKVLQSVGQEFPTSEWAKAAKELLEDTRP